MPPPISTRYDDERALLSLGAHDHDHEINVGRADLTRFGPDLAGVKTPLGVHSTSAFSPTSNDSKSTRPIGEFRLPQHNATDSFAESVASTDSNAEEIELSSLHSFRRTDRAQSFVGQPSSHGRFESIASSSTTASLPSFSSTSASEDEYIYGDEIRVRSAVRLSLEQAGTHPRAACPDSRNTRTTTEENPDDRPPHEIFPPLTPMSPRQTRFLHRIYVPESTHHDNTQLLPNDFSEVDINSPSSSSPARHTPDSEHTIAIETDSLLPVQKLSSQDGLPLPATSPSFDEPDPFRFSYSHSETVFYLLGFSITTLLVVLSVWLTLADIVM
ncbi:hypothetical protein ACEPAF_2745 [Sanghuangporus sanghuang]